MLLGGVCLRGVWVGSFRDETGVVSECVKELSGTVHCVSDLTCSGLEIPHQAD